MSTQIDKEMRIKRDSAVEHVSKALKQIDANTWIVGRVMIQRQPFPSDTASWNDDRDGSSYTLTDVPLSHADATPATDYIESTYVKLIYECADWVAVWSIGNDAILKVKYRSEHFTSESETLKFVRNQKPSFEVPEVLHYSYDDAKFYLLMTRLQGRTLDVAWPTLDEDWKKRYVDAIVAVCIEMAQWERETSGGVDQKITPDSYLRKRGQEYGFLVQNSKEIGMDCSAFVFYHADLGPTNIIVEDVPTTGKIGIIDFEISGYFPRTWIRTKFRIGGGLDLNNTTKQAEWTVDDRADWRRSVQRALDAKGFEECAEAWMMWRYGRDVTKDK